MQNESQLDIVLLSIYNASNTDKLQPLILKNIPLLLSTLDPTKTPKPFDQKKVIKTINDVLIFVKKHPELKLPWEELTNLIVNTTIPIQKNVSAIFLKLAIQRQSTEINLQNLMDIYSKLPASIHPTLFSAYITQIEKIEPENFVKTIQNHEDLITDLTPEELSLFTTFITKNIRLFYSYPNLFIILYMKLDCQKNAKIPSYKNLPFEIEDGTLLNGDKIISILNETHEKYKTPVQQARLFYLLSKVNFPFKNFDKIVSSTDLPFGFECLDRQLSCQAADVIRPHLSHLIMVTTDNLTKFVEVKISILRSLIKKCPDFFATNLSLFKNLFNSDSIPRSTRSSIIFLYSSVIEPTKKVMDFLEKKIFDDEDVLAMSILNQIYPFSEPRSKILACLLISDPNFMDECRILLHPYRLESSNGFRNCISELEGKAEPPTTADLFSIIEKDSKIRGFLLQPSSTSNVSALFNFAAVCKPCYPLPYDFIIAALDNCPNSANEISAFLVYITKKLKRDEGFNPEPFIQFIKKENDASIVESISSFLEWSGCSFDVDKVSSLLKGPHKVAFLAHFGCPFDECVKMLSTAGQSNLAKNCLMAISKRGLLDKTHFEKLFPIISNDPIGIEILSIIASRDVELCEKLTKKFFEAPFINSEHVEVIVSGARKLASVVDEDFLIQLIETGMKTDKSRRNSSIFLIYLVNFIVNEKSGLPKRLWFCSRTLLFCCGAENGVVRTAGLIGLNVLYRKTYKENKEKAKEIDDALYGRTKPPEEMNSVQVMSGQSRAQLISLLLKLAKGIPSFMDFLLTLIEPDFLIFTDIEIPSTDYTSQEERDGYAPQFFYNSFSPIKATSESFRKLWKWATDGGKKISIPELISSIEGQNESTGTTDSNSASFDIQQQNLSCVLEIISRMSQEQTAEFFQRLCAVLMKLVFSPVSEMSISGAGGLDKLVSKLLGQNANERVKVLNNDLQNYLITLCAKLFDTRISHLVVFATKWSNEIIPSITNSKDMIIIYQALFTGLGSTPTIPNMISGPTWPVFTKSVFRICELDLMPFLEHLKNQLKGMIVLDSQRYGVYYSLDSVFRSSNRLLIAKEVPKIIPTLFVLISNEKNDIVIKMLVSLITHGLQCILYGTQEVFPYEEYVMKLFFDDQKVEICGMIMKAICRDCADCLTDDISPFIVFASCFDEIDKKDAMKKKLTSEDELDKEKELKSRDFISILRDEIPLSIQVDSNPNKFITFMFDHGICSDKAAFYKPIGSRALLKIVSAMSKETKIKVSGILLDKIIPLLSGRLFPSKENLIDVINELIGCFKIDQKIVDELKAAAMRQKSLFRASAFNCLNNIFSNSLFAIDKAEMINIMIDAMNNGTIVAQSAAANCAKLVADDPGFSKFIDKTYEKMNSIELDDADEFCKLVLDLPPHQIPELFDKKRFMKIVASLKDKPESIEKFLSKIR